jgi:hypothetical protein
VRVAPAIGAVALATAIGVFATLHGNRALMTSIVALGIAIIVTLLVIASLFVIPQRDELIVLSGRKRIVDGRTVGYRILERPGLRVPMLETIDRLDLSPFEVPVALDGAFTQGGIPSTFAAPRWRTSGRATFARSSALGPRRGSREVTGETLEGHARGVLATLTPADVQFDLDGSVGCSRMASRLTSRPARARPRDDRVDPHGLTPPDRVPAPRTHADDHRVTRVWCASYPPCAPWSSLCSPLRRHWPSDTPPGGDANADDGARRTATAGSCRSLASRGCGSASCSQNTDPEVQVHSYQREHAHHPAEQVRHVRGPVHLRARRLADRARPRYRRDHHRDGA